MTDFTNIMTSMMLNQHQQDNQLVHLGAAASKQERCDDLFSRMDRPQGKGWGRHQDSLLGMASTIFGGDYIRQQTAWPLSTPANDPTKQNLLPNSAPRALDVTSQVLADISAGSFLDPPSDDFFDIEPVPLAMDRDEQRLSLLEETLNQVLDIEFSGNLENTQTSHALMLGNKKRSQPFMVDQPNAKRQRASVVPPPQVSCPEEDGESPNKRFRPYQSEQWSERFEELLNFRRQRGHCCVPHTFGENPSLARWVKRQRYQYKLMNENKTSTMTAERVAALEQIGFVWDSHGAAWLERWGDLVEFKREYGNTNVPSNYPQNPKLATWVKCQRRQYKLFCRGEVNNMTLDRIAKLEQIEFNWQLRSGSKTNKKKLTETQSVPEHTQLDLFFL